MKRITFLIAVLLWQLLAMAQGSGGEIHRPVKNNSQHSNSKPVSNTNKRDAILQNLINNMIFVEGGTFMMGATSEQDSDANGGGKSAHMVKLDSYRIGKYEVTQEEWLAVMESNPSKPQAKMAAVNNISWNDCQEFIRKLHSITGLNFRLPTEAEWEYAARGGNRSNGYMYAGSNILDDVAWNFGNGSDNPSSKVGLKKPNELGLYDMSGNVEEWCQDWYDKDYYKNSPTINPYGPSIGSYRVVRGGSIGLFGSYKIWERDGMLPQARRSVVGFRLSL